MWYQFRAGIEHRIDRRGRDRWRAVGEYKHVSWNRSGPGLERGWRSRWYTDRYSAVKAANEWLDRKEHHATDLEYVGEQP